jgi:flagellar biogenesis protein FliO
MQKLILVLFLAAFMPLMSDAPAQPAPAESPPVVQTTVESAMPSTPSYEGTVTKMVLTLVGLIALVILTVWVLRRLSQGRLRHLNSQRSIKIVEKRVLSPKSMLYVVEVGGQKLLISESQVEVRALSPLADQQDQE